MGPSSSESRSSGYLSSISSFNKPRSASTPPTSIAPSSSPPQDSSPILLRKKTTIGDPIPQVGGGSTVVPMKSCGVNGDRHKRPIQYALFQGGARDEDCELPTKRHKTLQTTWNYTPGPSSEATRYLNERMLELSRITRRAVAARLRYQRLRSHELDLIKSIVEDEKELSEAQLKGIDFQIGSIRNTLQDGGVISNKGCRFDPSDTGPWCESSSDNSSDAPVPIHSGSHCSSVCASDVEE